MIQREHGACALTSGFRCDKNILRSVVRRCRCVSQYGVIATGRQKRRKRRRRCSRYSWNIAAIIFARLPATQFVCLCWHARREAGVGWFVWWGGFGLWSCRGGVSIVRLTFRSIAHYNRLREEPPYRPTVSHNINIHMCAPVN